MDKSNVRLVVAGEGGPSMEERAAVFNGNYTNGNIIKLVS
jgi:hypothetical protein